MSSNSPNHELHPVQAALENAQTRSKMEAQAKACLRKFPRIEWDEVVNEATKRALERKENWDPSRNDDVASWLCGFVRNVARELARCPPCGAEPVDTLIDKSPPATDSIDNELYIAHVLGQLKDPLDIVILTMARLGHTADEIGAKIMMRANTVRMRLHRSRCRLRIICGIPQEGQL